MSCASFRRRRLLVSFAFVLWIIPAVVSAASATLAWDPSEGATGYTVRWGTVQGTYPNSADAGNNTSFDIPNLTAGGTYWVVVQAYNSTATSDYSLPLQFTVPLACTYSISPTGINAPGTASSGSITVTTPAGCAWTTTSGSSFLTFQNGTGRTGTGTVTYSVAANTTTTARTLTANVAGLAFNVSQAAAACTYSISPTTASTSDAAGTGSITVTTGTGCAWSATSGSSFLTFTNGTGRTGPGTVSYNVAANTTTSARTLTATVAGQAFSVAQAASAACTFSISPATTNVSAAAASGSVTVTTGTNCAWSATSASSFLTFTNGTGRTGSGTVTYNVAANTTTSARTLTATVAGQAFSIAQAASGPCTYSISPATTNVSAAAGSGSITVTTGTSCAWSATSASSFLTFTNGTGRTGPGTVSYNVAANTTTSARTLTATVAGQAFSIAQAAPPACTYSINPATMSVSDAVASGTITVTTQTNCAWSATSTSSFLAFQNGTGRTGSGTLTFSVTANTGMTARTGTGTVAGKPFSVSQAAPVSACTYTINPANANAPAAGTTGSVTVTTQAGCPWTATSAVGFLTFTDGAARTGSGTANYVVATNPNPFRTATGTVAGKPFTLWQAAASACTYSISPATVTTGAAASTGTVTVTTQANCGWNATSLNGALTFQDGTNRSGPGSVSYTAALNEGVARNVIGLVAGATFTVAQAGGSSAPHVVSQNWSSDFNADGKNDILVRDSLTGSVEAWFLDNATVKGRQTLSENLDTNWMLVGRGDFNGDGKPDIVWQHKTDGRLAIWYMDGTTRTGLESPSIILIGDPGWTIVGVGDFNDDGYADLAWQHIDGTVGVWLMVETSVLSTPNFLPERATDLQWKVVGVGDFNGDGKSDLLWRHGGTGELGAWLMNGLSRVIHAPLNPLFVTDQRWQVGAVTDANGDGKPDIIWQHTDGTIMIWHMNGTSRVTFPTVPGGLPIGWTIAGPK